MPAEHRAAAPRIGIAGFGNTIDPAAASGTPGALHRGLRGWGALPTPVPIEAPSVIRVPLLAVSAARARSKVDAQYMPEQFALRSVVLRRRLRRAGPLDGVVSLGADVEPPPGSRYVLYSDMTLRLAREVHPVFARVSDTVAGRWDGWQRRIYRGAHAVCAGSRWCADSVIRDYGVPPERVHVTGYGANHDPPHAERDWEHPRFLFVGREWERKNGPMLVRAFARLRTERPDAELHLVGGHPTLSGDGVHTHGALSLSRPDERARVERLFAEATCFVMPSVCEPFGIGYVEAGRAGVPSIATSVGGTATAVGPGGVLVEPEEERVLEAMRRLSDPDTACRLGLEARRHSELLTWERVTGRLLRALELPGYEAAALPDYLD
jgi:glycosyltransferase involved in cell wall biosynthesis